MRNLLIFVGALLSILGMSLFHEIFWIKLFLLKGGVVLVLVGLLTKDREEQVSDKGNHSNHH